MKLKRFLATFLTLTLVVGMTACSGKTSDSKSGKSSDGDGDSKKYTVVYLSPSTESEYWQYGEVGMRNAIVDLEKEDDIKINFSVSGPATEAETDAYVKAYESVIASQPDAIITATLAPDGTVPKTKEAQEAGIYVNFVRFMSIL